ncbi:rho GTPase-activating protein conundrum-like isoform X1 [Macrosteles quadrilineatus]|uniref:rho GTPase-activating protein conundrum-like isoform X1 n=2 Tax=Macrosteles quadrilineatus TaxID=74068 RepID=UPI0023E2C99F|nr:rho GTPase-activating protein conundrum-like isoform X1 [Macrosteles quadrilineatus]
MDSGCVENVARVSKNPPGGEEMEAESGQDFQDYWNEIRIIQETKRLDEYLDEEYGARDDEEGEGLDETEWLVAAGLGRLREPFLEGKEVSDTELDNTLALMAPHQAQAVRRRVDTLNHTIRQRQKQLRARHRRPDIRDVFRDYENSSTGSRSRSATPDSLDSAPPSPPSPWPPTIYHDQEADNTSPQITPPQSLTQIFEDPTAVAVRRNESRREVRRLPSAPVHSNLFRAANLRYGADIVASETADGIKMLGYHRLGSVRYTFNDRSCAARDRLRSDSDPANLHNSGDSPPHQMDNVRSMTRSQDSLYSEPRRSSGSSCHSIHQTASLEHLGFEETWAGDSITCLQMEESEDLQGRTWVEWLGEEDLVKLQPLAFLELTVMLDQSGIRFPKRKPHKRKRKEDGPVIFGASLASLLEKDQQITSEPHNVPLVFQKVLAELERRGLHEEGILRVAAHKQKVQALCDVLEKDLYTAPERVDATLLRAPVHDLATLLKRLIRDLPESLLTNQLVDIFTQAHSLAECSRALNLLILLLPTPNRATLQCLLKFLNRVISNEPHNKMSAHNVAMIIAPSLFPPRFVTADKGQLKTQINYAAVCCRLTETMLQMADSLFLVPPQLLTQLRRLNEQQRYKHKENKPMKRLLGRRTGRDPITRKIDNEVDFQEGVVRVSAPSFLMSDVPVVLTPTTTAGEVVLRLIEQSSKMEVQVPHGGGAVKLGRKDKSRALSELAPNGNLSCLLATADTDMALQTHFLHEMGGNIGQRRIDPNALLLPIYQENPNAQWLICCDHKNGSSLLFKK